MGLTPLFSSPLYQTLIQPPDGIVEYIKQLDYERSEGNNGWISVDQQVINKQLDDLLDPYIAEYIHTELSIQQSFVIVNSWVNKHTKGDYLPPHTHANSLYTGIYYIQVPPDSGNVLTLATSPFTPTFTTVVSPTINQSNIYNSRAVDIPLEKGTLLLFPSHIEHSAPISNSTTPRYALSFNIFLKGLFGQSSNLLTL